MEEHWLSANFFKHFQRQKKVLCMSSEVHILCFILCCRCDIINRRVSEMKHIRLPLMCLSFSFVHIRSCHFYFEHYGKNNFEWTSDKCVKYKTGLETAIFVRTLLDFWKSLSEFPQFHLFSAHFMFLPQC